MGRDDVEWNGNISWDADKNIPLHYTTDPAAAMQALMEYYRQDPNDVLPALHNFLIGKEFTERTMTPEKVCRFIKEHFEENKRRFSK